jgi:hypothetical protein
MNTRDPAASRAGSASVVGAGPTPARATATSCWPVPPASSGVNSSPSCAPKATSSCMPSCASRRPTTSRATACAGPRSTSGRCRLLPAADVAYCALGTTIRVAGSGHAFQRVDLDAVIAFGRAARAAGVTRFGVVSALGADPRPSASTTASRARWKWRWACCFARPSLLIGNRGSLGQPGPRPWALRLTVPLRLFIPKSVRPISAAAWPRALLRALAQGRPGVRVVESGELYSLGP